MVKDWFQIQAIAPVFIEICIKKYLICSVPVQHKLCAQCRLMNGFSVLYRNTGAFCLKSNLISRLLSDPSVFEVIQMSCFLFCICPESCKLRRNFPDCQSSGIFICILSHWFRNRQLIFLFCHMASNLFQECNDLLCHQFMAFIIWMKTVRCQFFSCIFSLLHFLIQSIFNADMRNLIPVTHCIVKILSSFSCVIKYIVQDYHCRF